MLDGTYGRIVSAPMIERGVEVCLRAWLGPYLGETLAQAGLGRSDLPDPTDLVRVSDFTWPTESQVALVVVASPGTVGDAIRDAESYALVWDVTVGVLADVGERLESREAAQLYAAAAGTAVAHKGCAKVDTAAYASGGRVEDVWVTDEDGQQVVLEGSSAVLVAERTRALGETPGGRLLVSGEARLLVLVEGARARYGGPDLPPIDPATGLPGRAQAEAGVAYPVVPHVTITPDEP